MRQYNTLITALLIGKGNYHVGDSTIIMYLLDIWIRKENVNLRVILPQVIINFDCGPARSKNNDVTKMRAIIIVLKVCPDKIDLPNCEMTRV